MLPFSNAIRNLMDTKDPMRGTQSYALASDVGPSRCASGRTFCPSARKTFFDPVFKRVTYVPARTESGVPYEKGRLYRVLLRPYAMVGIWDGSGTVLGKAKRYHRFNETTFVVPAVVVVNNLYKKGGFALGR